MRPYPANPSLPAFLVLGDLFNILEARARGLDKRYDSNVVLLSGFAYRRRVI